MLVRLLHFHVGCPLSNKDFLLISSNGLSDMQIVSGSRDKTIKLWNTLGECKYTIREPDSHTEWVSTVRFSPVVNNPIIVSAGWDKMVKVWGLSNCKLRSTLAGHTGYINTVTVSPDGSLCASGGKVTPTTTASTFAVCMKPFAA